MASSRAVDAASESEARTPDAIRMYGDFLDNVSVVKNSLMSLLLSVGDIEAAGDESKVASGEETAPGRTVLVPFVEMKLEGEQEPYFANVLTLDNVAYLIYDLAQDFEVVCQQLLTISNGGVPPEARRIEQSAEWMKRAGEHAGRAFQYLEKISDRIESVG
ncbi:hypothetical protein I6F33_34415 [Bradyrhizobium sp. BRP20]|uniref:hypothetical protein n=1 Tax=unclassified Bradyrhizobium TaxID=2631580 RepID=UPI001CD3F98E|nr:MULTISPECIES: hypothetical protein [unclassified Bradyrhizobium]MCA1438012.1 hypothetical protein [Bradyrhizobium sp. BRP20]MCA1552113.1 hypothetical protein [Bradyrhizobium sp. BRP19]